MKKKCILAICIVVIIGLFIILIKASGYEYGKAYNLTLDGKGLRLIEEGSIEESMEYTAVDHESEIDSFENINLNADIGNVNIVPGDKDSIKITSSDSKYVADYKVRNNTLTFTQKANHKIFNKSTYEITIYYDKTKEYKDININLDYGDLTINDIKCNKLIIDNDCGSSTLNNVIAKENKSSLDAGDIYINSCEFEKLDVKNNLGNIDLNDVEVFNEATANCNCGDIYVKLCKFEKLDVENDLGNIKLNDVEISKGVTAECDAGDIKVSGILNGISDLSNNLGNITANIKGISDDFKIDADTNLGEVIVDGEDLGGKARYGSGDNILKLDCDSGNINIDFN